MGWRCGGGGGECAAHPIMLCVKTALAELDLLLSLFSIPLLTLLASLLATLLAIARHWAAPTHWLPIDVPLNREPKLRLGQLAPMVRRASLFICPADEQDAVALGLPPCLCIELAFEEILVRSPSAPAPEL